MAVLLSLLDTLSNSFGYVFWVILALFILVLVHELGHFLAAKAFGMRVERFSIGFPPKIVGKQIGETEYVIGATPLGGYVKIAGMVDESLDTAAMETIPEPWEFRAKPVWQKIVVITAGVIFNMILAIVIFSSLKYFYGEPYIPVDQIAQFVVKEGSLAYQMGLRTGDRIVAVNGKEVKRSSDILNVEELMANDANITVDRAGNKLVLAAPDALISKLSKAKDFGITPYFYAKIGEVQTGSPADKAGLKSGDAIVQMNNQPIRFWEEMSKSIKESKGQAFPVKWVRASAGKTDTLSASIQPYKDSGEYRIGVGRSATAVETFGLGGALEAGISDTFGNARATLKMFKKLIFGQENVRDAIGGPLMIARETKRAADQGAYAFWRIVALLSVTLAVVNIMPIPALDGGHLVFLIYEAIARREPSLRFRIAAQQVGMVLLLALMVFIIFNDVLKMF
jgi:regulator of sigma E protease